MNENAEVLEFDDNEIEQAQAEAAENKAPEAPVEENATEKPEEQPEEKPAEKSEEKPAENTEKPKESHEEYLGADEDDSFQEPVDLPVDMDDVPAEKSKENQDLVVDEEESKSEKGLLG